MIALIKNENPEMTMCLIFKSYSQVPPILSRWKNWKWWRSLFWWKVCSQDKDESSSFFLVVWISWT